MGNDLFCANISSLRNALKDASYRRGEPFDVQVLPLPWRNSLKFFNGPSPDALEDENSDDSDRDMEKMIENISLPSVSSIRGVLRHWALDGKQTAFLL